MKPLFLQFGRMLRSLSVLTISFHVGNADSFAGSEAPIKPSSSVPSDVAEIRVAIRKVQQLLSNSKVELYAQGIAKAASRYRVDPMLLVAIIDQESDFQEGLPEGKMGEIGLCQIRKSWLKNSIFRAEFKRASKSDLNNPAKSFLYAAWILRDLKMYNRASSLPYWSRYNSPTFEFRQKYFALVNPKLKKITSREPVYLVSTSASPAGLSH